MISPTGSSRPGTLLLDPLSAASYSRPVNSLPPALQAKEAALFARLREAGRLIVAYSGGVDSSYLAYAAWRALGPDCLAVTALSPSYPEAHRAMAEKVVAEFAIPHRFVRTQEMESPAYRKNSQDRCYHCKSELFRCLGALLDELDFNAVAYGVNTDDMGDFRPGRRAAEEQRVLSPFLEVGLSKQEIRSLSQVAGLASWDQPASACLASRLPYGTEVTDARLRQVEAGEDRLRALGFRQLRLRHHGELARIEIDRAELQRALEPKMRQAITAAVKPLGFRWVCLDLDGYRTGSLNESLDGSSGRES